MALFDGLNGIILTTDECQVEKEKERRGEEGKLRKRGREGKRREKGN